MAAAVDETPLMFWQTGYRLAVAKAIKPETENKMKTTLNHLGGIPRHAMQTDKLTNNLTNSML